MPRMGLHETKFTKVYPLYVRKAERKDRTKAEVDELIEWLTGYDEAGIADQIERESAFDSFFAEAPRFNTAASEIKGVICGRRVRRSRTRWCRRCASSTSSLTSWPRARRWKRSNGVETYPPHWP